MIAAGQLSQSSDQATIHHLFILSHTLDLVLCRPKVYLMSPPFTVDIDVDICVYSKSPEMVTTFGHRTCHKSVYEGSMYTKNQA
jgi:hypothetical protein